MKKQTMTLAGIPAILYGSRSRRVYLYLHGKNGCKEEAERFAATACEAGWQVLAIDLPEHGARKNSPERLLPWVAVPEIEAVYARMKPDTTAKRLPYLPPRCPPMPQSLRSGQSSALRQKAGSWCAAARRT